jgi:hypothetical protein
MPSLMSGSRRAAAVAASEISSPYSLDVDADERVALVNAFLDVAGEEAGGVVAADAERGLGEIVGAEAEELGFVRDVAGAQGGAGELDHGADEIVDAQALLVEHGRAVRSISA